MNKLNSFVELLASGCVEGFCDEFNEDIAKELFNSFKDILKTYSKEEIVTEVLKDCIAKNYLLEMAEYWTFFVRKTNKKEKFFKVGNILCEKTNIHEYLLLLDFENEVSFVLNKLLNESLEIQRLFSNLFFYVLAFYSRESLKQEIESLIDENILEKEFYIV